jgi:Zn-dependent protease
MEGTFRLGSIGGINIEIHYTWLFAFALITWTLAVGFFPTIYPEFEQTTYWILGAASALLLFASVLVHELAHSFVAIARHIPVHGITLFIFGGVSQLRGEAESAGDEFTIAIVGPVTSVLLAGVFWAALQAAPPQTALSAMLAYLAFINLLLGIFNLLPGFPLDGGRVLRAILWKVMNDMRRATDIAARVGQFMGFAFIAFGVYQLLGGNFLGGLWIAFIGWFLNSAAEASRRQATQQALFQGIRVHQLMDPEPERVTEDMTIADLVYGHFLARGRRALAVCDNDHLEVS